MKLLGNHTVSLYGTEEASHFWSYYKVDDRILQQHFTHFSPREADCLEIPGLSVPQRRCSCFGWKKDCKYMAGLHDRYGKIAPWFARGIGARTHKPRHDSWQSFQLHRFQAVRGLKSTAKRVLRASCDVGRSPILRYQVGAGVKAVDHCLAFGPSGLCVRPPPQPVTRLLTKLGETVAVFALALWYLPHM